VVVHTASHRSLNVRRLTVSRRCRHS
jgi:hypothetical protein